MLWEDTDLILARGLTCRWPPKSLKLQPGSSIFIRNENTFQNFLSVNRAFLECRVQKFTLTENMTNFKTNILFCYFVKLLWLGWIVIRPTENDSILMHQNCDKSAVINSVSCIWLMQIW